MFKSFAGEETPVQVSNSGVKLLTVGSVALLFLSALWLVVFPVKDYDTFWHLANGRAMLEQGRIIHEEIFSYSAPGTPFPNHSWLAQIIMFLCYRAGGISGLILLKLAATTAVCFLVYRTALLLAASRFLAGLAAYVTVLVGLSRFVVRPQLFSYLALALLAWILYGYLKGNVGKKALWVLPLLMSCWDFMHGAVFGFVFWGALATGESIKLLLRGGGRRWQESVMPRSHCVRTLWFWLGVSFFVALLKPRGLELYKALFSVVSDSYIVAMTGEFLPTDWDPMFRPFWLLLVAVVLTMLGNWRRLDLAHVAVLVPFAYLGIRYNRCVAVFAIVAAPLAFSYVQYWLEKVQQGRLKKWVSVFAVAACTVALLAWTAHLKGLPDDEGILDPSGVRTGWGINKAFLPMGAVDFIQTADLQGNMFNNDRFGGMLAFYLYPERRIFHYNHPTVFVEIYEYLHNPLARAKWNHNYALVATPEEVNMFSSQNWVPVYRDASAMVMVRPALVNEEIIERYEIRYFHPLMSSRDVRRLFRQSTIAGEALGEAADYLMFNQDGRISALLTEGISAVSSMPEKEKGLLLQRALRSNAWHPDLLGALGLQLYRQGRLSEARGYLEKARRVDGSSRFIMLNLGFVNLDMGLSQEAEETFRTLLKEDGSDPDALYGLALSLRGTDDVEEFTRLLKKYLEVAPQGRFSAKVRLLLPGK